MEILKEKYSITELSEILQVTDHTLRFYEKEFCLTIPKDERGRRFYTTAMANTMYKIKLMRSEGLEIKAIKKILQEDCVPQPDRVLPNEQDLSLASTGNNEYEAMRAFFNEFGKQLASEIFFEVSAAKDELSREINKSKLELGACVENSVRRLETKLEKHFSEVDTALGKWRERSRKRPLKRFLSRFRKTKFQ